MTRGDRGRGRGDRGRGTGRRGRPKKWTGIPLDLGEPAAGVEFYKNKLLRTRMASGGRERGRGRRGYERDIPTDNQAEFLAAMTNLANTIQAGVEAMNQARGNENADQ
ncbi:hypothetical protein PIB30_088383 [Stylosanthes scabra]|uniref:Uncharacterized protein n=1 Tax=Stylosanthes scabra TaxID=79078 RepID=A0ABU6VTU9_9FABA|nr:hypothetical protein [Stylosanthes scabra]